jgi:thiol:disulfide interchange protein DsbA
VSSLIFDRRRFVLALLGSAPAVGFAGPPGLRPSPQAGDTPYRLVDLPNEANTVIEIMAFDCPYCRQINDGAVVWGATLPPPFRFVQMPLTYDAATARGAAFFETVRMAAPNRLQSFEDAMFASVQDRHEPLNSPKTAIRAAVLAGVSEQAFKQALTQTRTRVAAVTRAYQVEQTVRPRVTPTFVIGGKYVIDATDTGGDYGLLFKLAGGLVSQLLTQRGASRG